MWIYLRTSICSTECCNTKQAGLGNGRTEGDGEGLMAGNSGITIGPRGWPSISLHLVFLMVSHQLHQQHLRITDTATLRPTAGPGKRREAAKSQAEVPPRRAGCRRRWPLIPPDWSGDSRVASLASAPQLSRAPLNCRVRPIRAARRCSGPVYRERAKLPGWLLLDDAVVFLSA